MSKWLLFTYKVPSEPSARRVYVWRKLKGLGAILLHDSAWVLPSAAYTREKLQWLAAEVREMEGGEAALWEAEALFTGQEMNLAERFIEQSNLLYREILAELDAPDPDLEALARRFVQAQRQDYLHADLAEDVRQKLLERRGSQTS